MYNSDGNGPAPSGSNTIMSLPARESPEPVTPNSGDQTGLLHWPTTADPHARPELTASTQRFDGNIRRLPEYPTLATASLHRGQLTHLVACLQPLRRTQAQSGQGDRNCRSSDGVHRECPPSQWTPVSLGKLSCAPPWSFVPRTLHVRLRTSIGWIYSRCSAILMPAPPLRRPKPGPAASLVKMRNRYLSTCPS